MVNLRIHLANQSKLVRLACYGVVCDIYSEQRELLDGLRLDFSYFVSTQFSEPAHVNIILHGDDRIYSGRKIVWPSGTIVYDNTKHKRRRAHIICKENSLGYIENYLHSVIGEELEKRGWFRMHACGTVAEGHAKIWMADSGSGKSVHILKSMNESQEAILGDEILYFKNGYVFPFPIPVATAKNMVSSANRERLFLGSQKSLTPIPPHRIAQPTSDFTINYIGSSKLMFIVKFVLGLGLPQMRVYLVRANNLYFLFRQAFARLKFALALNIQSVSLDDLRERKQI